MMCQNCPLCVSDYSDACGDGDIYCLVTGDYANDEGGCSRTNKWILAQDREALKKKRQEEECAAWSAMAEYYENNRDIESYKEEIKYLKSQIDGLIDELSRRDLIIDNLRDAIKVRELADKSYALSWISKVCDRMINEFNTIADIEPVVIYITNKERNKIIQEIKGDR